MYGCREKKTVRSSSDSVFILLDQQQSMRNIAEITVPRTKIPKELDIVDKIDYTTQFDKSFSEPLKFITDKINWLIDSSYGEQGSLEDFFN